MRSEARERAAPPSGALVASASMPKGAQAPA